METVSSFYGVGYGVLADAGDVSLHVIAFFFCEQFYRLQDFFTGDGADLVFGGIRVFQKIVEQGYNLILDIITLFFQNIGYRHRVRDIRSPTDSFLGSMFLFCKFIGFFV